MVPTGIALMPYHQALNHRPASCCVIVPTGFEDDYRNLSTPYPPVAIRSMSQFDTNSSKLEVDDATGELPNSHPKPAACIGLRPFVRPPPVHGDGSFCPNAQMALDGKAIKEEIPDKDTYETSARKLKARVGGGREKFSHRGRWHATARNSTVWLDADTRPVKGTLCPGRIP
uniref:Uncharacterized protein n=1 Tax=Anopheles culicifacies TaxID=139723 RepID=A0A182M7S5_9DIPT